MNVLFHGLFKWDPLASGAQLSVVPRVDSAPRTVPCPDTGRALQVATVEISDRGVCPACVRQGAGGYVSFVSDLRLAFACPGCKKLVWIAGA